jgi:hypothetical protein
MVKAQLSYNPYLLETSITFNGREPKINSLVEKYQAGNLQNWIAKLPDIFYNEMNGWDFDLDFTGTKIDFDSLQAAFDAVGVSRESVSLFHKNELECVERKCQEISDMFTWFKDNPNRRFAFADFWETNSALFEADYSFIIIQGPSNVPAIEKVTIENVPGIEELAQAVLDNTPVLFYINEKNRTEFRRNLVDILKRPDVRTQQLFFCISSELSRSQVERVIRDLGVERPQIVDSPSAAIIKRYFKVYPMTVYVQRVIEVLRAAQSEIGAILKSENEQSIKINGAIHQKIDNLGEIIQKLKSASERTVQRDNFVLPDGLTEAKNEFVLKIINWRKKKIKMTSDEEAVKVSSEFTSEIRTFFREYISKVMVVFQTATNDIGAKFYSFYCSSEYGDKYHAKQEISIDLSRYALPELTSSFLKLKDEQYISPNDSPFGFFKDVFGESQPGSKEPIRVVTYQYQKWRDNAATLISPLLEEMTQAVYETLKDYYERVAQDYLGHLKSLIEQQTHKKDDVSAQLSDDERKLQSDNDWFSVFKEKLREIERS